MDLLQSFPRSYHRLVVTLENLLERLEIEDIHGRIIREVARRRTVGDEPPTRGGLVDSRLLQASADIFHHCKKEGKKSSVLVIKTKATGKLRKQEGSERYWKS